VRTLVFCFAVLTFTAVDSPHLCTAAAVCQQNPINYCGVNGMRSLSQHHFLCAHPYPQVCSAVAAALQEQQAAAPDAAAQLAQQVTPTGHTVAVFGGLLPDGSEQPHSSDQLHILWLHPDATLGVWLHPSTTGHCPAPRAFACCAGICHGTQLLVYGGAANGSMACTVQTDVGLFDGYLLLCVYILDTDTLHWFLQPTRPLNEPPRPGHVMLGISTCPGPRKRALSCLRVNPVSGQQEFMLLGGCGLDGLADFVPYSLNLQTF
jgi:hypothetical protein